MVNVQVPQVLVPFNLFGTPLLDDDLDDYLNLAPNHYILVGRGPGGQTGVPTFRQYRAAAEEFVREIVAEAALRGRVTRFDIKAVPHGASPIGLPLPIPWAILTLPEKEPAEGQPAEPQPEKPAPDKPPAGAVQ